MVSNKIQLSNQPLSPALAAFMAEYEAGTTKHPLERGLRLWQDKVIFEVGAWDGAIHLSAIMSLYKGCGEGSQALRWLLALADKHGVVVKGYVQRIGRVGLGKDQLFSWYRRNGFTVSRDAVMRREPR